MKSYHMGRFAIDVPIEMKLAVQAHRFRGTEVEDFEWASSQDHNGLRAEIWQRRLDKIHKLELPRKVKKHVIEEVQLNLGDRWTRSVMYYGDYMSSDEGTWDILMDSGRVGLWMKYKGLISAKEEIEEWILAIARAYHPVAESGKESGDYFYLEHGAIDLPYQAQESTYSRFENRSSDTKIEVEMDETHEVEKLGLAQRLAAAMTARYAPGVAVDKIRSRTRDAAGLKGEELVIRMHATGEDPQIQFCWEYAGEAESGRHPEVQISMETSNTDLDIKLKLWDAVLSSFRPMYR